MKYRKAEIEVNKIDKKNKISLYNVYKANSLLIIEFLINKKVNLLIEDYIYRNNL